MTVSFQQPPPPQSQPQPQPEQPPQPQPQQPPQPQRTIKKLIVEVVDARDLLPKDGQGSSSAYVVADFDGQRKRTAELKNNLEGYIYATKEKLETSEEFEKISTSEERQTFIGKLDEVQEWLYMDGEEATASEFQERLDMLKAKGDPIFFRAGEDRSLAYTGSVLPSC